MNNTTTSDKGPDTDLTKTQDPFVVGIGSSAGGLEALRELVGTIPTATQAAYVIVQHISPAHKSLMTTLISRETTLSVRDAEDGLIPEPGTVYVTPPNKDIYFKDGALHLQPASVNPATPKPSIDRFLKSLAAEIGERSVAVILSGTGSDGSYGVQAIREAGGITIAQDHKTAKYDGMPVAAVGTGCVDLVLSPAQIGMHLSKILTLPRNLDQFRSSAIVEHPFSDILQIILARTRVDFREYKPSTIQRRIERRMTALDIEKRSEYTRYCRAHPAEVDALFKDLLISVTRFFRDPAEFYALRPFIRKLADQITDRAIRIWVAGCATGEEAYSIAMLFADAMGGPDAATKERLQIFATDIDRSALETARRSRYSAAALDDIPDSIAEQYVTQENQTITIDRRLKDIIVFSEHNICQDPPFLYQDLICCRNLLIYFGASLQSKVLSRLHYSLLPEGYLFLGTSEAQAASESLFRPVSSNSRIFRKRPRASGQNLPIQHAATPLTLAPQLVAPEAEVTVDNDGSGFEMFEALARALGSNSILLTEDFRIARVFGDISRYLSVTEKTKLYGTYSMLAPTLAQDARTLASVAARKGEMRQGLRHNLDNDPGFSVRMTAYPLKAIGDTEAYALLVFHREPDVERRNDTVSIEDDESDQKIAALNLELTTLREELQQTIEEQETTNEELQSLNEELQSTNEELQATNEELETSNEELQSTNEELITLNEELTVSTTELSILNDEQEAVLASVPAPMLIIDTALQVTKANEAAINLFRMSRPVDRRHISQCEVPESFPNLSAVCNEAMHLGTTITREIELPGKVVSMTCAPFYNKDGQIRGATMIFPDFQKSGQDALPRPDNA